MSTRENSEGGSSPSTTTSTPEGADHDETRQYTTPAEHRRNRKSWTEAEKREFWQRCRVEKKERKRAQAASVKETQQAEWEALTGAEKDVRRAQAVIIHEKRRAQEAEMAACCTASLADPATPIVVFDLSFAWCMTMPDTKSTVAQVKLSYSALRHAAFPMRPVITSLAGKEGLDTKHDATAQAALLANLQDFEGFRRHPVETHVEQHWSEVFPKEKVVFLTADSSEVLTSIEPGTAYVIGTFVDHNQHKGLSKEAADRHEVRTARLPIAENIDLSNRCKVLTINHVVMVLSEFLTNGHDWKSALETVLPVRRTNQEALGSRKRRWQERCEDTEASSSVTSQQLADSSHE